MEEETIKVENLDDSITIDRNPVPLAFCARPTLPAKIGMKTEDGIVDQLLDLVDPITVVNPTEIRQAPSLKSFGCDTESEFEFSGDDSDFENINDLRAGALDSDEEFDRLVKFSAKIIEKTHKSEYPDENGKKQRKPKKSQKTRNVHEYDDMPPLENLSIECKGQLLEFGFVSKVVDCQVVIISTCTEVLDFDSFLFDQKGNALGQIYDIFGQVKNPQYVIRFNSCEEASMIPIDMKVYYAPTEEQFSKTPFKGLNLAAANRDAIKSLNRRIDHQEAVAKAGETMAQVGIGSDVEFSDDEAEKEFKRTTYTQPASQMSRGFDSNRGRKRDRRGGQKVRFSAQNPPARSDNLGPIPQQPSAPPPPARPAQSTESNPYAEFGCHSGFNGRFGI